MTPKQYLDRFCQAAAGVDPAQVEDLIRLLENAYRQQKTIYIFGNGGSGANASHFCEDLGKGTLKGPSQTGRFRVMSLTDNTPYILAWANDEGFETIFEQQLRNFAQPEEVAIGISGSGNSPNVLEAIAFANSIGMHTVGFTGYDGGRLKPMVEYPIHVPSHDMGMVESVHQLLLHYIVSVLRTRIQTE
jgi:D-sedoheptulose 7-phosphate isomerase